jgi:hypothetical protein
MAADKRRTLWDRLTGANVFIANEDKYHNPFKVRIGNTLHIDTLDYRGPMYSVKKFEVIDRATSVTMTDYHLTVGSFMGGKAISDEKKNLLLRTVPRDGTGGKSKIDFRIVALSLYYECAWDDESRAGIMEGVSDPAGEFVINAGTTDERKFWRLGGLKNSESATITTVQDADSDVLQHRIEMWGFSRTTQDEAKQDVNEYLYVQKDTGSGWLQIFIGKEVPPERINV